MQFAVRLPALLAWCASISLAGVTITPSSTVLIGRNEPPALKKAAADLVSDLGKVFGTPVRVVHSPAEASPETICIALAENLPTGYVRPSGTETLSVSAIERPWKDGRVKGAIVLSGSDPRGAIYAVYHFSQHFLGVDPFWYWTDHAPAHRNAITMATGTRIRESPVFRYRGWFVNDEDLLTTWKPGNREHTGISLEIWDKVFEALLRSKGNMIVPGTFLFPDEPQVRAASARGLIISQHHIEVVGTNTWRWPAGVPYSFASHPEFLINAWRHSIEGYAPGEEVIWTVGYRGRHDRPFWDDDPTGAATDVERANLILAAIKVQMQLVRRRHPDAYFLMNAWDESVPFIRKGLLKLPEGVTLVWPDNGHGVIRDDGTIAKGQGIYYHTAMYNYRANQLSEMVPVARIERELGRAARAGATEYLLINTSDLRPVTMTTRAAMELAWNPRPWISSSGESSAYLNRWAREEFGEKAAPLVAEFYRAYFAAPARYGEAETLTMGDSMYQTLARDVIVRLLNGKAEPPHYFDGYKEVGPYMDRIAQICRKAEPRWRKAREFAKQAEPFVPAGRRSFFHEHVLTQLAVNEYSNRMLIDLMDAARAKRPATAAIADAQRVVAALNAAEYGKWAGFYQHELFDAVRQTIAMMGAWNDHLKRKPIPAGVYMNMLPPDPYQTIKAYQGSRRVDVTP